MMEEADVDGSSLVSAEWDRGIATSYNRRDLLTYALGIGCSDLHYVYEGHSDFAAFPTYPVVLGFKAPTSSPIHALRSRPDSSSSPTPARSNSIPRVTMRTSCPSLPRR